MIEVIYKNKKTGQKMIAKFDEGKEEGTMEMSIEFKPDLDHAKGVNDPFGVMERVYTALTSATGVK